MKISPKIEYAFLAILELCFHYPKNTVVPLGEIAKKYNIPLPFLEQVMLVLKKTGYVTSKKGKKGGFVLARSPEKITLGEIFRALQGPIEIAECTGEEPVLACPQVPHCVVREVWQEVNCAVLQILDERTFSQLMKRALELREKQVDYIYYI